MPRSADQTAAALVPTGPASLRTGRILCAIGALVFPLFWFADRGAGVLVHEPFWVRALLTAPIVAIWAGSFVSERVQRSMRPLLMGVVYMITANGYVLLGLNDLNHSLVVGTFVVQAGFIAIATYTVTTVRQLLSYLGFNLACALAAVIVADPRAQGGAYVLLAACTVASLAYVTVSSHIATLRRLIESETALSLDIARCEVVERALRESEARSRALVEAIPDVMLLVDQDGRVLEHGNRRHDQPDSATARRARAASTLDEILTTRSSHTLRSVLREALRGTQTLVVAGELRGVTDQCQIEIRITPTASDRALALVRDVTQERELDARMRIADRMVALGTLAGGVAHEINNPLSYVLGNVTYALTELGETLAPDSEVRSALTEAEEGCRRIRDIVRDLKDQSQPGESTLDAVDVNEVIESSLRVMDNQLRHRARVSVELGEVPLARASASRLSQVLVNLLGNAADAMPDRPMEENVITIRSTLGAAGAVLVEVRDNGSGIAPELLDRIFDPFFTTKGPGAGTGLGLYLCHRLVTSFCGTITALSEPGRGSSFVVTLLAAEAQALPVRSLAPVTEVRRRVLVVDDEPAVARALTRMLRGYEVSVADSADSALELCASRPFEFVLCDVMMPGKDGAAFYAELERRCPELAKRVIFVSGGAFTPAARRFLSSIDNPVLEKPIDPRRLIALLTAAA